MDDMRELVWPEPELVAQLREGVDAIKAENERKRLEAEAANGRQ